VKAVGRAGGRTRGGEEVSLGKTETLKFTDEEGPENWDFAESKKDSSVFIYRKRISSVGFAKSLFISGLLECEIILKRKMER